MTLLSRLAALAAIAGTGVVDGTDVSCARLAESYHDAAYVNIVPALAGAPDRRHCACS